mmetsp:Transcript_5972/g.25208  ORF Transcript_5972/g.25208 Transcript_5972/m.25208 type:complete len:107 (+) Transcript_5972:617-937(+)
MKEIVVSECVPDAPAFKDAKIIFSGLDNTFAGDIEDEFAKAGKVYSLSLPVAAVHEGSRLTPCAQCEHDCSYSAALAHLSFLSQCFLCRLSSRMLRTIAWMTMFRF